MDLKPMINVIIPVYNVEKYLARCINSIIEQTYDKLRIVLVDDGSTDSSPLICDEIAKRDERIIVIHQANMGVSGARNTGLQVLESIGCMKGDEYITFVDSDDYVSRDYISFLYYILVEYRADISQCGYSYVYSKERIVDKKHTKKTIILDHKQALESLCYNAIFDVAVWGKLYALKLFRDVRFPQGYIYEDTAVSYLLVEHADCIAINMQSKYYYTQRKDSIANGDIFKPNKLQLVDIGDKMAEYILQKYPDMHRQTNVKRIYVRLSTLSQMVNCNYYNEEKVKEYKNLISQYGMEILLDRKVAARTKIGVILILLGYPCYRAGWKIYRLCTKHYL